MHSSLTRKSKLFDVMLMLGRWRIGAARNSAARSVKLGNLFETILEDEASTPTVQH